jgi:hypothetical protein
LISTFSAFGKHFAQHGSAEQYPVFLVMGAGYQRGHAVTEEAQFELLIRLDLCLTETF